MSLRIDPESGATYSGEPAAKQESWINRQSERWSGRDRRAGREAAGVRQGARGEGKKEGYREAAVRVTYLGVSAVREEI